MMSIKYSSFLENTMPKCKKDIQGFFFFFGSENNEKQWLVVVGF